MPVVCPHPQVRLFNVGKYRRNVLHTGTASFFDMSDTEAMAQRQMVAQMAMDDMLAYFASGGEVAIFDATNSTRKRREWILDQLHGRDVAVVFVESLCTDEDVLEVCVLLACALTSHNFSQDGSDMGLTSVRQYGSASSSSYPVHGNSLDSVRWSWQMRMLVKVNASNGSRW